MNSNQRTRRLSWISGLVLASALSLHGQEKRVFMEKDGMVVAEAEDYAHQSLNEIRSWYRTSEKSQPNILPDGDPVHYATASGGVYLEVLPDTRRTHDDKLIHGDNFSNQPGKLAVLTYPVVFKNPGRYYVWVRAFSTGSEDNGIHVGLNGQWPESGQRMQWCEGKQGWRWESKQRTAEIHCGEPYKIFLDINTSGVHQIHFSMREDGFEFDKWFLTLEREYPRPQDAGPEVSSRVSPSDLPKQNPE